MIHEYAIEPQALVELVRSPRDWEDLKKGLMEGQPRVVSRYPKNWKKRCLDVYRQPDKPLKELEITKLTELLEYIILEKHYVKRVDYTYNSDLSWLENVAEENQHYPFRAILATDRIKGLNNILLTHDDCWPHSELWDGDSPNMPVSRSAHAMVEAVQPLLAKAKIIHFVDPYFDPSQQRFRDIFIEMLKVANNSIYSPKECIAYHVSAETQYFDFKDFKDSCQKVLTTEIPLGMEVHFKIWHERKKGGEKLHNRYILTNLGGVSFGTGLDTGKEGQTDDVIFLSKEIKIKRWDQYVKNNGDFIILKNEEFSVIGQK